MPHVFKMKFLGIAAILVLSGCYQASAPKNWQHKTLPPSQWATDYRKCQRAADKYLSQDGRYDFNENASQFDQQMRLYTVGKKQKTLVADCMRKLGYVATR